MHTMRPRDFIHEDILDTETTCPECRKILKHADGFIFCVPYINRTENRQEWGLMNFCSTNCILGWFPRNEMGRA